MSDSVGQYLNEIGMVPLLNAQEERELSQIIEAGADARARERARFSLHTHTHTNDIRVPTLFAHLSPKYETRF